MLKIACFAVICIAGLLVALSLFSSKPRNLEQKNAFDVINKGWADFRLADFDQASRKFTDALVLLDRATSGSNSESLNNHQYRLNALYGLGLIDSLSHHGEKTREATLKFEQIIAEDRSPDRNIAAWAALAMARDQSIPDRANLSLDAASLIRAYDKVSSDYPGTPASQEAFLYSESLKIVTLSPSVLTAVIAETDAYLQSHPDALFKSTLYSIKAKAAIGLGNYDEAFRQSVNASKTKEIDRDNPNASKANDYYSLGLSAEFDLGDFDSAREYFASFLKDYPNDQRAFIVQLELRRMNDIEARLKAGIKADVAVRTPLRPIPVAQPTTIDSASGKAQ